MTDPNHIPPGTVVRIASGTTASTHTYGRVVDKPAGRTDTQPGYAWIIAGGLTHLIATGFLTPVAPLSPDSDDLRALLVGADVPTREDILDRLAAQIGNANAWTLFEPIDSDIRNTERIGTARARYAAAVTDALDAVTHALKAYNELAGELHDVEIVEGSGADLANSYLIDARRALATTRAINFDGIFTNK